MEQSQFLLWYVLGGLFSWQSGTVGKHLWCRSGVWSQNLAPQLLKAEIALLRALDDDAAGEEDADDDDDDDDEDDDGDEGLPIGLDAPEGG